MMSALKVQDVFGFYQEYGKKKCVQYLMDCNKCDMQPSSKSYEKSIEKLVSEIKNLKKSLKRDSSTKFDSFLTSVYTFPTPALEKRVPKVTSDDSLDLNTSLSIEKEKCSLLKDALIEESGKNLHLYKTFNTFNTKVNTLEAKNEFMSKKLESTKKNLKRTVAREKYAINKVRKLENECSNAKNCENDSQLRIAFLENKLKEKDNEIRELETSVEYLQGLLNDTEDELKVFDEKYRKYTSKLKQCVYELLQHQVSASKVSNVIKSVLKLANITANRLPCKSSVLEMSLQRLYLAQAHISDVFSNDTSTVLLTDETSKYGSKFMGYEASDSQGNLWVLGLRDIETKSANDTLKVFKEILQDLDDVSMVSDNEISRNIICHIVATLSDRAATEVKFNQLLVDFRKEILPLTYYNYNTFTEAEKVPLETMCNFFCGLHALVNFAETARTCVKEVETGLFENVTPCFDKTYKDNDPGTCRLIRTASKAFGEGSGGDEKSGCHGTFKVFSKDFLNQHGFKSVPLKSYRGARFNILFHNAAVVFFLHSQMKNFLESYGSENRLLKSVLFDLKSVEFLAGVKALGLISKIITCPLWKVLENGEISLVDMNEKYLELVTFLEDASRNITNFMSGELFLFGENYVEKGPIFDALMGSDSFDNTVEMFLQIILPALCKLSKRLFQDHLPDGVFTSISDEMKVKVKNAPKTSCFAESVFGQLDHLLRTKPNISTLAAEASIMFLNNKTLSWLDSKEDVERDSLIKTASKGVKQIREKYRSRLNEIHENRRIAMNEKIRKREASQQAKIERQEQYTRDILFHGLWQSEVEVENMVNSYERRNEKIEAVKAQLKFRKDVLQQIPDNKSVFNLSKSQEGKKSRKYLDVDELKENLKVLVRQAVVRDTENNIERHLLVGKRVKHRFITDGEEKWYTGRVISQVLIIHLLSFKKGNFHVLLRNSPFILKGIHYYFHKLNVKQGRS